MDNRFSTYQSERFPILYLLPTAFLITLGMALYSTTPFEIPFSVWSFLCASLVTFTMFALTRIGDEHRDFKYDSAHHKDRPVPSGLITLTELKMAGFAFTALCVIATFFLSYYLLISLVFVLGFCILNSSSFFMKGYILKRTELFIFLRAANLFFADAFIVITQAFAASKVPDIFPTLCYMLSRLFAFYAFDIALRRTLPQTSHFKNIRHILLYASTALSFVFFVIALTFLNSTPFCYVLSALAFLTCMTCIFFSNTRHRLLRVENFGCIVYCLIVGVLPCFVSQLI